MPITGIKPSTIPILIQVCVAIIEKNPTQMYFPSASLEEAAFCRARSINKRRTPKIKTQPIKPNSSPATVKIKSFSWKGTELRSTRGPLNNPLPVSSPEAMEIFPWYCWYPFPIELASKSSKARKRLRCSSCINMFQIRGIPAAAAAKTIKK